MPRPVQLGAAEVQAGTLGGAAAVSPPYIFIPTQSGILIAVRGGN